MKHFYFRYVAALLLMGIACSQTANAQSYQWSQAQGGPYPEWATTWRNSPDEVAQAYCDAVGAPQHVGMSNGGYIQSCSAVPNSGHPWPAANVMATRIMQTNCQFPGGCQQSINQFLNSQMVTRLVTSEFFVSRKQMPNLPSCTIDNAQGDPIAPSTCSVFSHEADIAAEPPATSAFNRYYNSIGPGSADLSAGWFHSFGRRLNLIYQTSLYRPHDASDPDNSSLYSTPALACTSGFPQIRAGVPNWVSATASYSGGICTLSVGGVPVDTIPVLSNQQQNPLASTTLVGVNAIRDDGATVRFLVAGGSIVAPTSVTLGLQQTSGGFTLTDTGNNVESYDATGKLLSIASPDGRVTTMAYDAQQRLATVTFPFGHALTLGYDILNRLTSVIDPGGRVVVYGYDAKNRFATVSNGDSTGRAYLYENTSFPYSLTGLIDENGTRLSTWGYDTQGRAISTEEAGGANRVTFIYNADSSVTSTDALGAVRTFTFNRYGDRRAVSGISGMKCPTCVEDAAASYDLAGFVASRTDYNGNVTCYAHDARGLETVRVEGFAPSSTCPSNLAAYSPGSGTRQRKITSTWHSTLRLPLTITLADRAIGFTYDSAGNMLTRTVTDTSVSPSIDRVWTYTHDATGKVLTQDGPRIDVTDVTTYTYYNCTAGSQCGQIHTITNALGHITTFNSYSTRAQPTQITDANGLVMSLGYDTRMRLKDRCVSSTLPGCSGGELTHLDYWPTGLLKKVINPDGSFIEYSYDAAHRLTQIKDGALNKLVFTLDAMGNRTAENIYDPSNALRRTHTRVFNTLNQLWKDVNAAGTANVSTVFGYDSNGNQTTTNAPLSRNSTSFYDELNRLTQITDPASGNSLFGYDANDNLTSITDPRSLVTSYTYTGFGDLKTQTSPDTGLTTNTFDSGGNLDTSTDSRGAVTDFDYDAANRVTSASFTLGGVTDQTISYSFDTGTNQLGRLTGASDAAHTLAWSYDTQGRITGKGQTVGGVTLSMGYGYNASGQLSSTVLPSGATITYGYNTNGQVTSLTLNGSTTILSGITYDPFGPITSWTWGNSTTANRAFDTDGKITQVDNASGASLKTYSYDDAFRITGIAEAADPTLSWTYGHDLLDRLNSASKTGTTRGWTFDANGNRLTQTGTTPSTYTNSGTSNRVSSISGALSRSYSYDAAGNTLSYAGATFTYNNRGRMATAANGGVTATYTYNALGQRIRRTASSVTTLCLYDEAGHLAGEYTAAGALIQETVWLGDVPVATLRPNGSGGVILYYVHADHLNTPRLVTDTGNNIRWSWESDPFGTTVPNENPSGLGLFQFNLRFPGQQYDAVVGLHYNYFRDYDPAVGRYIESDPVGLLAGVNTYAYAFADPARLSDPFGLSPADVQNILDRYRDLVKDMTSAGQRTDPGFWNNMRRSFHDVTNGLVGERYLGCAEQALEVQSDLRGKKFDDKWTFLIMGDNYAQIDYNGNPTLSHWWVVARSNNPSDPTLVLDPWRNAFRKF